jgi:hypothetical protein
VFLDASVLLGDTIGNTQLLHSLNATKAIRRSFCVMANNVYKFRRVKWGDPRPKLKVLVEDFKRVPWINRISSRAFVMVLLVTTTLTFAISICLTHFLL